MKLTTDITLLVLSTVNNDLFIYVFTTGAGCEIRYKGTAELKNTPYISARVTFTINLSVNETHIKDLDAQPSGEEQKSNLKRSSF